MTASAFLPFVRSLRDAVRQAAQITPPQTLSDTLSDTPSDTPLETPVETEVQPLEIEPERTDVLLFSPHPDDEALVGGLPLRLAREAGLNVVNVAVTLGSRVEERAVRRLEAERSCALLGFDLMLPSPEGFSAVNLTARHDDPAHWAGMVHCLKNILQEHRPACIFLPHAGDWHSTHVGTHWLVKDALQLMAANGDAFGGLIFETEYWCTNPAPNLMVESSPEDTALLVAAAARHASQVGRNPYHLRLPAFMLDTVRRGGELINGQYAASPDMDFATLYTVSRWKNNTLHATPVRPALRVADRLTRSLASMVEGDAFRMIVSVPEAGETGKTSEKTSEKILRAARENPGITIAELAVSIGVSTRSVERNIRKLQDGGRLARVGSDKGGHWEVRD